MEARNHHPRATTRRIRRHHDSSTIATVKERKERTVCAIPGFRRVFGILLLVSAFIIIDISAARLRYHYRLISDMGPLKAQIESSTYEYHGEVPGELQDCRAYDRESGKFIQNCTLAACEQNALLLSTRRQEILVRVRSQHPFAEHISELFDGARGVNQTEKISSLFARKTCERIISSSDKTNRLIDLMSLIAGIGSLFVLWLGFRLLLIR